MFDNNKKEMKITEYSTFYKIENPHEGRMMALLAHLHTVDYDTGEDVPYGFFHSPKERTYRIPKGVGASELKKYLNYSKIQRGGHFIVEDNLNIKLKNPPLNEEQETVIEKAYNHIKRKSMVIIDMPTGEGKTYSTTNIITKLNKRPIIFAYKKDLLDQWEKAFLDHTDIRYPQIFRIEGRRSLSLARDRGHEFSVFLASHRTIQNCINDYGYKFLNEMFAQMSIGVKVYDECDVDSSNMFRVDCHTSIEKNIYLTATMFRSSKYDNKVFQYIFNEVPQFGSQEYSHIIGNRKAMFLFFKSKPSKKEYGRIYFMKKNNRISGDSDGGGYMKEFRKEKYHNYLIYKEKFEEIMKMIKTIIDEKRKEDPKSKFCFFFGRKDTCYDVKKIFLKLGYKEKDLAIYHSDIPPHEKEKALEKPILISISNSLGRGSDIKGMKVVIDFEAYGSLSQFKQAVGRCGRKGGTEGLYIKAVDLSFDETYRNYTKFKKVFGKEFKEVENINI